MICWRHLTKMVECGADEPSLACPVCLISADHDDNIECRADFFKALVAASHQGLISGPDTYVTQDEMDAIDAAPVKHSIAIMYEIERRVEAGTLFGKGGGSDG